MEYNCKEDLTTWSLVKGAMFHAFPLLNVLLLGATLPIFVIGYVSGEFTSLMNYGMILASFEPMIAIISFYIVFDSARDDLKRKGRW